MSRREVVPEVDASGWEPSAATYRALALRAIAVELGDRDPALWTPEERAAFVGGLREPLMMLGAIPTPPSPYGPFRTKGSRKGKTK